MCEDRDSCATKPLRLLDELGTDKVVHDAKKNSRPLMGHLMGTMHLLQGGGYDDSVCIAGLLHSIYGTNQFTIMSLDPAAPGARDRVREAAGDRSERLAFLFHSINRPDALEKAFVQCRGRGQGGVGLGWGEEGGLEGGEGGGRRGEAEADLNVCGESCEAAEVVGLDGCFKLRGCAASTVYVSKEDFQDLIAIEVANLLEQYEFYPERWPGLYASEAYTRIYPVAAGRGGSSTSTSSRALPSRAAPASAPASKPKRGRARTHTSAAAAPKPKRGNAR